MCSPRQKLPIGTRAAPDYSARRLYWVSSIFQNATGSRSRRVMCEWMDTCPARIIEQAAAPFHPFGSASSSS